MNVEMELQSSLKQAMNRFLDWSAGRLSDVRVFFAPGRVNLIGEHIDYNGGPVFPAALELGTWAIVRPRQDGEFRFASTSFPLEVSVSEPVVYAKEDDFANYPKGVIWAMGQEGVHIPGADMLFVGNLPNGAGLSSSASIELVTGVAINAIAGHPLNHIRLAQLGQRAENQFVGVNSGIMDQFASAMGRAHHAILLDCGTLEYRYAPLPDEGVQLVVTNTNKRRGLADSKYNERRAECDEALRQIQQRLPNVSFLAQVTQNLWSELEPFIDGDVVRRRAKHVVTETARVREAVEALELGNLARFGQLLNESHVSLRDDFEVTGVELDALAEAAWDVDGCLGSRMTGAGFGGCTVSLVKDSTVESFKSHVARVYHERTGLAPSFYTSAVGDGAREVTEEVAVL